MSRPAWSPSAFILALVAGPMPLNLPTGSVSTNVSPILGRIAVVAIRLAVIGGKLRQKLVVGYAGGCVEAGHLLDLGADRVRDVARQWNFLQVFGDVQVGLVQRQRFDGRRVLGEDIADLLRDRLVDLEAGLHEDQVRALTLGR